MNYKGLPTNLIKDKRIYNFEEYSPKVKQLLEHFPYIEDQYP
jgi:hypothetical protein